MAKQDKLAKNSLMKSSALNEDKQDVREKPKYKEEEDKYLANLQTRLTASQTNKDATLIEFDGLSYPQYYAANERIANTILTNKLNKGDTKFQSGTVRTKLMAILAHFESINLEQDINAYDQNDNLIQSLGDGMETIILKTEELELDEEKRSMRQYELVKQGSVFLEEKWVEQWRVNKKLTSGQFGQVKGVAWSSEKKKDFGRPEREIISGLSVYLGDMRQYFIEKQPYIFTVKRMPYAEAETIFGDWERWVNVPETVTKFNGSLTDATWVLSNKLDEKEVEVVVYQDKPNNEIQVILNGVLMLPIGYPLSDVTGDGEYTIVQQNLSDGIVRHDFAYSRSFIFNNKNLAAVLDRMMELAVLKTHKSYAPPYLNLSERVLSRDVFNPGKITRGVGAGELVPINDKETQGVTQSEFNMISEVKNFIDQKTVSQTFSGQKEKGNVTATQIVQLQQQAQMMMAMISLGARLLEKKLTKRRLVLLLAFWFLPMDGAVDETRKMIKQKFRSINMMTDIGNKGQGLRVVKATNKVPSSRVIKAMEDDYYDTTGMPMQIIYLNSKMLRTISLCWEIVIVPKQKRSSALKQMLFNDNMTMLVNLGLIPNREWAEARAAQVMEEDPSKMFAKTQSGQVPLGEEQSQPGQTGAPQQPGMDANPLQGAQPSTK